MIQLFQPEHFSTNDYQKITKKFLEVYRFNEKTYAADQEKLEENQQSFTTKSTDLGKSMEQSTLDWRFLTDWLAKKHIMNLDESLKEQLTMYHLLYGVDELTLGEWVVQAYDFSEQTVSVKELQRIVLVNQQTKRTNTLTNQKEEATSANQYETPKEATALTNATLQLVNEVKSIPPMKYLEALKQAKGGYVSKQETWLLQDLVSQSGLSNSLINILINYVLVIKDRPSLTASFVNTIANEWAQKRS